MLPGAVAIADILFKLNGGPEVDPLLCVNPLPPGMGVNLDVMLISRLIHIYKPVDCFNSFYKKKKKKNDP